MASLITILKECKARYYESMAYRRMAITLERPIFSFTFDDIPTSAVTNGSRILDEAGYKGTFYVALGLGKPASSRPNTGSRNPAPHASMQDVRSLHRNGHHVGCHTFSHYNLSTGSASEMVQDCLRSRNELSDAMDGAPVEHFSYPYGNVSFQIKRLLGESYRTLRWNRPGINHGIIDLNLLRANSLYSWQFSAARVEALIRDAQKSPGWLIFYTHGVEDQADQYGTSPEHLAWTIKMCRAVGGDILSVKDAYEKLAMTSGAA